MKNALALGKFGCCMVCSMLTKEYASVSLAVNWIVGLWNSLPNIDLQEPI